MSAPLTPALSSGFSRFDRRGSSILAVPLLVYGVGVTSPHVVIGTNSVAIHRGAIDDLVKPANIDESQAVLRKTNDNQEKARFSPNRGFSPSL